MSKIKTAAPRTTLQPRTKVTVWVQTEFEGYHWWPSAPTAVDFLRHRHRHMFKVRAEFVVGHLDRELEFFLLKWELDNRIHIIKTTENTANWSCERWAMELLKLMKATEVTVSEDGENGATVQLEGA